MAGRIDIKKFVLVMLFSLVLVTIVSTMVSQYTDIEVLKTGNALMLMLISVFIAYIFVIAQDGKIDKQEIFTMIFVAIALIVCGWVIKKYFPDIFSIFPQATKNIFSSIIK